MSSSNTKSNSNQLPKNIRDELRLTAAMYCYSLIRQGRGKTKVEICNSMSDLFHGKESTPSHIKMLANALYSFNELFDTTTESVIDKDVSVSSSVSSVQKHTLKTTLTLDESRVYTSGIEITALDLEKKNRTGNQLMSGRQILDLAKKGTGNYRKALAYASRKYDLEGMHCIESGTSKDDVIQFVRDEMYKNLNNKDEIIEINDGENQGVIEKDIEENQEELEEEYIPENVATKNMSTNQTTDKEDESSNVNQVKNKSSNTLSAPKEWFFPGFFSFMTFGPFVPKDKRLSLLEITDPHKDIVKSRAQKRKAEKIEKDTKRASDIENDRGLSTDQQLQVEMLKIQKQRDQDRNKETLLVGLNMQESAISRQIDMFERRAIRLDAMGTPHNCWDKIDELIKKQEDVVSQITELNRIGMLEQVKNGIPTEIDSEILMSHSNTASTMSNTSTMEDQHSHNSQTSQSHKNTQEENTAPVESPTPTHNSSNCSAVIRQNLQVTTNNTMNNEVSI